MNKLLIMIENLVVSVPFEDLDNAPIYNYFQLVEMSGEFLVIQKEDGMFYFLCSHDCPIEKDKPFLRLVHRFQRQIQRPPDNRCWVGR